MPGNRQPVRSSLPCLKIIHGFVCVVGKAIKQNLGSGVLSRQPDGSTISRILRMGCAIRWGVFIGGAVKGFLLFPPLMSSVLAPGTYAHTISRKLWVRQVGCFWRCRGISLVSTIDELCLGTKAHKPSIDLNNPSNAEATFNESTRTQHF